MKVSIIVTTRNEEKNIERCLKSLCNQTHKEKEIIVVDNKSTDRTKEIAKKYTKRVYNIGPERSAQRNKAIKKATGKYILVLDADMELPRNLVKECVKEIKKGYDSLIIPESFIAKGFWSKCKTLEKSCYTGTNDAQASRFFKKSVLKNIRGYDEQLTGTEDIDLHKRIIKAGYKIGRAPVKIIHYDEYLTLKDLVQKRYYYSTTLNRYLKKHQGAKKKEMRIIRPAFIKNWKALISDPIHLIGFIILRFLEGIAVLLALKKNK